MASRENKGLSYSLYLVFIIGTHDIIQVACKAISMVGDPKAELVRKITEVKADVAIVGSRNYGVIKR